MSELVLPGQLIEDSAGTFDEVASQTAGDIGIDYRRPDIEVPRPSFALVAAQLGENDIEIVGGSYKLAPRDGARITLPAGLRGFAAILVESQGRKELLEGPAIVLPNGNYAMLTAEKLGPVPTPLQHDLLDIEFAKAHAEAGEDHQAGDGSFSAIDAALIVVSTSNAAGAHSELHTFASGKGFGTNFSATRRQDFVIGHDERRVLSMVVEPGRARFVTAERHQLPPDASGARLDLTPAQLAIGYALAASETQGRPTDVRTAMRAVVG